MLSTRSSKKLLKWFLQEKDQSDKKNNFKMATMMRCREASRTDYHVRQERSRNFQEEMEKQQELAKQKEMCNELK